MIAASFLPLAAALAVPGDGGRAADFPPLHGPGRACFKSSAFDVVRGERLVLTYPGAQEARATVRTARGKYIFHEKDNWYNLGALGELVLDRPDMRVYRQHLATGVGYAVFGPIYPQDEFEPIVQLRGSIFRGTAEDRAIYARVRILSPADPARNACVRSYSYFFVLDDVEEGAE